LKAKEDPTYDPNNTELVHRVPSLDMRPTLELFAPGECSLRVKPCEQCGGSLEVVHRESKRVAALSKVCADLQKTEQECRSKAIRMEVQANKDRKALQALQERFSADREVFLRQINDLKDELASVDYESFERMRKNLIEMQKEFAANEERLAGLDQLQKELDDMTKEAELLKDKLEEAEVEKRELERLRAEAVAEKDAAFKEVDEYSRLLKEEKGKTAKLEGMHMDVSDELKRAHEKNARIQKLLDESRKNEAYMKQQISIMEQDNAEAMEAEQQRQEDLVNQVETLRNESRAAKKKEARAMKDLEEVKNGSDKEKKFAKEAEGKRITTEFETKMKAMQDEYEEVIGGLRKELVVNKDAMMKAEQKFAAEKGIWGDKEAKMKSHLEELREEKRNLQTENVQKTEEVVKVGKVSWGRRRRAKRVARGKAARKARGGKGTCLYWRRAKRAAGRMEELSFCSFDRFICL
jgi:hypothetical protein